MKRILNYFLIIVLALTLCACRNTEGELSCTPTEDSEEPRIAESYAPTIDDTSENMIAETSDLPEYSRMDTNGSLDVIESDEAAEEVLEYITSESGAVISLIKLENNIREFRLCSEGNTETLILEDFFVIGNDAAECCLKYSENGRDFLIAFSPVIGSAFPADIVTFADNEPLIVSEIDLDGEYEGLFYSPSGGIVCMRGNGRSIGAHNVIPYYWDNADNAFKPYGLHETDIAELEMLDKGNIIVDKDRIISVYKRDNGLVHVNYLSTDDDAYLLTEEISATYIITEDGLREYSHGDECFGTYLKVLHITE